MRPASIREALTGPVASQRVPFTRDGEIDWEGLAASISFNIAAGSKTILLTYGDSLFSLLTDAEVAEVTSFVCDVVAGSAMVTAACHEYATPAAVEFGRFCRAAGVDVLMLMPPGWGGSATAETLLAHFDAVGAEMPLMIVTNIFASGGTQFGLRCLERLLECQAIVAVKDDLLGEFGRKMTQIGSASSQLMVRDRWAVFAGGQKQNHLDLHPYGCDGYLSTFITFAPEIATRYWSAIERDDVVAAVEVIRDCDMPFFDHARSAVGGFDAVIHGAMELAGICGRWRRLPYHSLTEEQMDSLADLLHEIEVV
ncbi:MAG: dihydrodipicolinate synthase family protein [Armatimonadota bacterium]|jgi:dihydrodipicolinate synthase/N-acetylneuraminate lyase